MADGRLVDHRTDIYSLGVTLYEFATGHHPAGDLSDAQLVLDRASFHHKSMRHWSPTNSRDFETVVMKSIAEFPHERYATAQEFADDLRRFLEGRPILATRPSLMNRAGKWARRHRGTVYAIAAVLLVAFIGQSVNSLLLVRKNREVVTALAAARDSLQDRGSVLDRFSTQLVDQLAAIPGAEGVRYQLLEDSLGLYQRFEAQAAGEPALATDLALAYSKMGTLSEKMGMKTAALTKYLAARDLWQARVAAEPSNAEYSLNLALCHNNVGLLLADLGRDNEALESLQSAAPRPAKVDVGRNRIRSGVHGSGHHLQQLRAGVAPAWGPHRCGGKVSQGNCHSRAAYWQIARERSGVAGTGGQFQQSSFAVRHIRT